jgi:hypothetical protein
MWLAAAMAAAVPASIMGGCPPKAATVPLPAEPGRIVPLPTTRQGPATRWAVPDEQTVEGRLADLLLGSGVQRT